MPPQVAQVIHRDEAVQVIKQLIAPTLHLHCKYFIHMNRCTTDTEPDSIKRMTHISRSLLESKTLHVSDKVVVPRYRRVLQAVETVVQPYYLPRHFSATLGDPQ